MTKQDFHFLHQKCTGILVQIPEHVNPVLSSVPLKKLELAPAGPQPASVACSWECWLQESDQKMYLKLN